MINFGANAEELNTLVEIEYRSVSQRSARWPGVLVFQAAAAGALIAASGTSISQTTPGGSNDRRTAPLS